MGRSGGRRSRGRRRRASACAPSARWSTRASTSGSAWRRCYPGSPIGRSCSRTSSAPRATRGPRGSGAMSSTCSPERVSTSSNSSRPTRPSRALAETLDAAGLPHQLTTADPRSPGVNALLVAARWPLGRVRLGAAPTEPCRWLATTVEAPLPLVIGAMHVPNRVSGRKYPFLDAVLACARRWRRGPALFLGDTNSGRRGVDEESPAFSVREEGWIDALSACGWLDAFRHLRADARAYTWYSPNGRN